MSTKDLKVTVICVIYNQEKYLHKCLDSLAEQKTDFFFEVILHDDASTDSSAEIITDYCDRYPDIFVPILQKSNQYSQGIPFFKKLLNEAKGEYIALCEGDDHWCDPYKLQKQYDYMKAHPECSMCVHNTIIHDLNEVDADRKFMNEEVTGNVDYLNERQIFNFWVVHYSSYFIRNNYDIIPDEWSLFFWARDYVMLTVAYAHGRIGVLNDIMSVYNFNNKEGLTAQNARSSDSLQKVSDRALFLKEYLNLFPEISTEAKTAIQNRINAIEEYTSVSEFSKQLITNITNDTLSDENKYEWLIGALNNEKLQKFCTSPSEGLETISYKSVAKQMFERVDIFLDNLTSLGNAVFFSFASWVSRMFQTETFTKDYLLAIAASPENTIGWGLKLDGNPEYRHSLVLKYANEENLSEDQKKELDFHKNNAIKYVENGNNKKALEEINLALGLSPLNKDLICYKAFILLCLRDKNACINEIGIYSQFYEPDENLMMIYDKVKTYIKERY